MLSKMTGPLIAFVLALAASSCATGEPAASPAEVASTPPSMQTELPPTALPSETPTPEPEPSPTAATDLDPDATGNMTYFLDILSQAMPESQGEVKLKEGVFEQQYPSSAEVISVRKIKEAHGDLNGDGVEDAIALLAISTGGSGTFINLAAVLNENGIPRHAATKFLGDRVDVQSLIVEDGTVRIKMIAHAPDDPACCPTMEVEEEYRLQDNLMVTPEQSEVLPLAETAIRALQAKDMDALSEMVDPDTRLRFSPYSVVLPENMAFSPEQLQGLLDDPTIYTWGNFDGSGEPIQMSFEEYFDRFIYSNDFAETEKVSVNQRMGMGNTLDNSLEFYPGAVVVEYHIPGENPDYGGMDWQSLRLVFQPSDGVWRLVGIIHDEWTT